MSSQKEPTDINNKEQLVEGKREEKTEYELTSPPLDMFPPNKSSMESDMPVESLRNTVLTLIFSLNTIHGYGILATLPFTEFYTMQQQNFRTLMDYIFPQNKTWS